MRELSKGGAEGLKKENVWHLFGHGQGKVFQLQPGTMQVPPGNALPAVLGLIVDMNVIRSCIQPACHGSAVDNTSMRGCHPVRLVQTSAAANYPFCKIVFVIACPFPTLFFLCDEINAFCRDVKKQSV